ncbi:hypothetical protein VQ042_12245 [Aurantimonas sp. A2-1-M11]|uniref:hypothetical protein n=1 Tax=Aurantimonas sp. A2-1-M11 TaxID=3113712 RepID=UPI002F946241
MNTMHNKGYEGIVADGEDAEIFHGEVVNLQDVITFQGASVPELKQALNRSKTTWPSATSGAKTRKSPIRGNSWCEPSHGCIASWLQQPDAQASV